MLVDHWIDIRGHFFPPALPEAQEEMSWQFGPSGFSVQMGTVQIMGDYAASAHCRAELGAVSNSRPKPEPSPPLQTAERTCSSRSAPRRDQRICCDLAAWCMDRLVVLRGRVT